MKLGSFVDDVSFCGAFIAIFVSFMVSFKMPKRGPLTDRWADVFYWMTQPAGRKKLNIDGGGVRLAEGIDLCRKLSVFCLCGSSRVYLM